MQAFGLLAAGAAGEVGPLDMFMQMGLPFIVMIALLYFMLIRPQKKRDNATNEMRKGLVVGDEVVTVGGISGKITGIKDDIITVETGADRVKIHVQRWAIQSKKTVVSE